MSILNLWVSADRALVGVDTLCTDREHGPKMLPFPHANCVVAVRGSLLALPILLAVVGKQGLDSFDAFDDGMPDALPALQLAASQAPKAGDAETPQHWQVAVVGYSDRRGAVTGAVHEISQDGNLRPRVLVDTGDWLSAWNRLDGEAPIASTVAAMEQIARTQKRRIDLLEPGSRQVGGRLIVAEITRQSMTFRTVCDLEVANEAWKVS